LPNGNDSENVKKLIVGCLGSCFRQERLSRFFPAILRFSSNNLKRIKSQSFKSLKEAFNQRRIFELESSISAQIIFGATLGLGFTSSNPTRAELIRTAMDV